MFDTLFQNAPGSTPVFLFGCALLFFCVAIFLGVALRRQEKKSEQRLKQARADITDMTILFQTMRDIIGQQKKLARQFNDELEHKMGQVKHILNQGMEKNKQLYEKQQRITSDLEEAQARIDAVYRQIGHTQDNSTPPPPAALPNPPTPPSGALHNPPAIPTRVRDVVPPAPPAPKPTRAGTVKNRLGNGVSNPQIPIKQPFERPLESVVRPSKVTPTTAPPPPPTPWPKRVLPRLHSARGLRRTWAQVVRKTTLQKSVGQPPVCRSA